MKKAKLNTPESAQAAEIKDAIDNNTIGQGEQPTPPPTDKPAEVVDHPKKTKQRAKKPQRVETILVRHDFTMEERANLGGVLADQTRVAADIEGEAKVCARQYKDKLAVVLADIEKTTNKIKEGFEMIETQAVVMAKIDKVKRTVSKAYYRKDTGQFIRAEDNVLNVELDLFNILPDSHSLTKPLPKKLLASQV